MLVRIVVERFVERSYFICPNCENALCKKEDLEDFTDNYCGNCGFKLTSAKEETLALALEKWNNIEIALSATSI